MRHELWDIESRFLLGRFATEAEALSMAADVLSVEGDAYAQNLELVIGEDGERNPSGADLLDRTRTPAGTHAD